MSNVPAFVERFRNIDPKMVDLVSQLREHAMAPGALDAKTKLLIAMALDAIVGADRGVASLADAARSQGATEAEISETLRIVYYIAGMGSLSSGANGLK
jgi:alkylhydroperoxidase/carboxymuconolactone decarboxylase family protein YurZ